MIEGFTSLMTPFGIEISYWRRTNKTQDRATKSSLLKSQT